MRNLTRTICWSPLILCLSFGQHAWAQTFRGGISGTVSDPSGAAIPAAPVEAKNVDTGQVLRTVTSSSGTFAFSDIPLGSYDVTVNATGFQSMRMEHVTVNAGQISDLPMKVGIASNSQTVEVAANALTLDTATTANTAALSEQMVQDLPVNGRDYTQMIAQTPGFAGYSGGSGFDGTLNGARRNQINWQLDGVDNNDYWQNEPAANEDGVNGLPGTTLPLDGVESFSVQTQSLPEAGRNPGGTVNITLRSGTNKFHGSAYYFLHNELFAAKNPFTTYKQKVRNVNWGGSLGAPILHDRLFFFGSFESDQFKLGVPALATMPSVAYQALALQLLAAHNAPVNTVTQAMLNTLWPASALTGPAQTGNFTSPDDGVGHSYNGTVKFDYNINSKNAVSFHWFSGEGIQVVPYTSHLLWYYYHAPTRVQNYAIVWNSQIDSHLSNQVLLGGDYFAQRYHDNNENFNPIALGFNTGVTTIPGAPNIELGASAQFDPIGVSPPRARNGTTGHVTDDFSWTLGAHDLRFGGEFRRAYVSENYFQNAIGQYIFDGTQGPWKNDVVPNNDNNIRILADFLGGYLSTGTVIRGNQAREVFVNTLAGFVQDNWKLRPNFTFNYGLRYDYAGPLHNSDQDLAVFRPPTGIVFQGNGVNSVYPAAYNNVSPRAGFTYSPPKASSLVIRGAAGLYFDTPSINIFLSQSVSNGGALGLQGDPAGANLDFTLTVPQQQIVSGQLLVPLAGTPAATCILTHPCGLFTVSPNLRSAHTLNYSLNIQNQLGHGVIAELGYVGSEARKLILLTDINQAALNPLGSSTTLAQKQVTRPYYASFPTYSAINEVDSIGDANYNALQANIRTQSLHGFTSMFSYVWSHNLDDGTNFRNALPQDSTNVKRDYGNSVYDITNYFSAHMSYIVPYFKKAPHWLGAGWEINGLTAVYGGEPFSIQSSADNSGTGEGAQRAIQVMSNPYAGTNHNLANGKVFWINPAAFVNAPNGTFVTSRRAQYRGPGYEDVDFSVIKTGNITEKVRLQFRGEIFNLFNHVNYAPFKATVGSSLGQVTDTIGDSIGAPGIGPGEPFNVQFAHKVLF